jgi:DNA adenine methylase
MVNYNTSKIPHCSPFVKWAGGKTQLINTELDEMIPLKFNRYFEPFLGGGAMFLHMVSDLNLKFTAYLSDINMDLIGCYNIVRTNVNELIQILTKYQTEYKESVDKSEKKRYYIGLRNDYNHLYQNKLNKSARFIALNKTCYNGMHRVNQKGEFNVPWGKYQNPTIYDSDNLQKISAALNYYDVSINNRDYKTALSEAKQDDFIYLDPPYYPISKTANFTSYSANGFSKEDHIALSSVFTELNCIGCKVLLSNSDTEFIKKLYSDFNIKKINASRAINCDPTKRGKNKNTELIISNYLPTRKVFQYGASLDKFLK